MIDAINRGNQKAASWNLLYDNDVFLAPSTGQALEKDVHSWKAQLQQYGLKPKVKMLKYMEPQTGNSNR